MLSFNLKFTLGARRMKIFWNKEPKFSKWRKICVTENKEIVLFLLVLNSI